MSEGRGAGTGGGDGPDPAAHETEDFIEEAYESSVEHGAERMHRDWRALLTTGFSGGLEIGLGLMACGGAVAGSRSPLCRSGVRREALAHREMTADPGAPDTCHYRGAGVPATVEV